MFGEKETARCEDGERPAKSEIRGDPAARGRGRPGKYDIGANRLDDVAEALSATGLDMESIAAHMAAKCFPRDDAAGDFCLAPDGLRLDDARACAAELIVRVGGCEKRSDGDEAGFARKRHVIFDLLARLLTWLCVAWVAAWAIAARKQDNVTRNRKRQAKHRARQIGPRAARLREWEAANPEKVRLRSRAKSDARFFVAIDSEGQEFPGDAIIVPEQFGDVSYAPHYTYLWGASSDADDAQQWLVSPGTRGAEKTPLSIFEILDWLLDLSAKFRSGKNDPKPIFVMFAAGYDFTQILRFLPRPAAWEIFKAETFPTEGKPSRPIGDAPVFWKGYAFSFRKGKYLKLWRLADGNAPYKTDAKGKRRINASAHIEINDTFPFFQEAFSKVVDSMVKTGDASNDEAAFLKEMKAKRGGIDWAGCDIEDVKKYTTIELRLLARIMAKMRGAFAQEGLRLRNWYGPGAAASAAIKKFGVREHFGDHVRAENILPPQEAAHRAYFGGRIEMLKQGYVENADLCNYDIASAYPAGAVELPSMKGGSWEKCEGVKFGNLAELRAFVESASRLSLFQIRFEFPEYEKFARAMEQKIFVPFYPFPYRTERGAILFPRSGRGWYARDDVTGAIGWLEKFVPDFAKRKRRWENKDVSFVIEEAHIFHPDESQPRPFEFVRELYNRRRNIKAEAARAGKYDIREKILKLVINSIYGKLAQTVGDRGKLPSSANPFYALAITAYCRRRLMEAALLNPRAIAFFATDGILSIGELSGLERVRDENEAVDLGDWEYGRVDRALLAMSGVYFLDKREIDNNGEIVYKPVTKLRGASQSHYANRIKIHEWIIEKILAEWRRPSEQDMPPILIGPYKKYITIGAALASAERWKIAGRWSCEPIEGEATEDTQQRRVAFRVINIHDIGGKRRHIQIPKNLYSSLSAEARRCYSLIDTTHDENRDDALSRPRSPKWLDREWEDANAEDEDEKEISCRFE